jgi:hypothetical protein
MQISIGLKSPILLETRFFLSTKSLNIKHGKTNCNIGRMGTDQYHVGQVGTTVPALVRDSFYVVTAAVTVRPASEFFADIVGSVDKSYRRWS